MPCYSPLKGWVLIGGGFTGDASKSNGNKMEVACGQCLGCRLDHSRMWSMRIIHEATLYDGVDGNGSSFITLTYDERLDDWSLCKRDFQLFMKRLRKKFKQKIRFYMCGEYGIICRHKLATAANDWGLELCPGCNYGRPHFHAILFNCSFSDLDIVSQDGDITLYESKLLTKEWGHGFASVGSVTMQSAGYVARYAVGKITGKKQMDHYISWNDHAGVWEYISPEFSTCSNRPGIGKEWFLKFQSDVFPSDEVPVPGEGVFKKVPRYYQDLMCINDEEIIQEVKARRLKYLRSHKEEFTPERLMDKYKVKKKQILSLERKL